MNTAGRRRTQAVNGYKHIDPMRRPKYSKTNAAKSDKHMADVIATERRIKGAKK